MSKGLFGDMFDFDNDGKLNSFEQAAELGFISDCMDEDEDNRSEDYLRYGMSLMTMMTIPKPLMKPIIHGVTHGMITALALIPISMKLSLNF